MSHAPAATWLYHITDVSNITAIIAAGGLRSDVGLVGVAHEVIGYGHIKQRRMTEYRVPCCSNRFVGEFVPFYFCPRSPMLYTVNIGRTGKAAGCQRSIVHLVTTVERAVAVGRAWVISDGNAGANHTSFYASLEALGGLNWTAIRSRQWQGLTHQKSAEFLVADFFPWEAVELVGCHDAQTAAQVSELLSGQAHVPKVAVRSDWYY